jgi:hypothetical protein
MLLFNQAVKPLKWHMSGAWYSAEPWGSVEVPDDLVEATKSRGIPLAATPIAPDSRARARVVEQEQAASEAVLVQLKNRADEAEKDSRDARAAADKSAVAMSEAQDALRREREAHAKTKAELAQARADARAADALLSEQAAAASKAEERAIAAEALSKPKAQKSHRAD